MSHFDGGTEDLQDEYKEATLKRVGLHESLEPVEMHLEYSLDGQSVREVIYTQWRPVTKRG